MVNQTRLRSLSAVPTRPWRSRSNEAESQATQALRPSSPPKGARPWRAAAESSTGQGSKRTQLIGFQLLKRVDRLRDAIERIARFVHKHRRDEARHPLRAVLARDELHRLRHHAVELAQAARMGVGITLDEPPATQGLDREIVVLRQDVRGLREPRFEMRRLPFVPQARAPRRSQCGDAIKLQEAADPPDRHAAPAIDNAVEASEQERLSFYEGAKRRGHHAPQ